jgi:chemotaxis protein MotA
MDIASILGVVSAFFLLGMAIFSHGDFTVFLNLRALFIVLGGTFGATLINYPLKDVFGVIRVVKKAFVNRDDDHLEIISDFIRYSKISRKEGNLALEKVLKEIKDQFLSEGIRMIIDGVSMDNIKEILRNELNFLRARHRVGISIFKAMGQYAPAFGMIGTLIGLIFMLNQIDNPQVIAASMAIALVTTFYGAIISNIVFLPIAGKLEERSTSEILSKEMVLTGLLSIQKGEIPKIVEQKMVSFLPTQYRKIYVQEVMK